MITYTQKTRLTLWGLILLSSLSLFSCLPAFDSDMASPEATGMPPSFTLTTTSILSSIQRATETLLPNWTMTTTASPTETNTPTPTAFQTPTPFPNGYVLIEEDFENGVEELDLEGGLSAWQIQDDGDGNQILWNFNQLKPGLHIGIGDQHWQNYQLEFEVKDVEFAYDAYGLSAHEILAILVRESMNSRYAFLIMFVGYNDKTGFTTEVSHVNLQKSLSATKTKPLLEEEFEELIEDHWYSVIIKVDEGHITLYWDGELMMNYQDAEYIPEGSIRFNTNYGMCFDNIRVTVIGNTELE